MLKEKADTHHCDARWTLARTDDASARKFAALPGVQYLCLASGFYFLRSRPACYVVAIDSFHATTE